MIKIFIIFEFLRPEYLKVTNSLLLKSLTKNICAVIKMKGNISKIIAGEFINAKNIVKYVSISIFENLVHPEN